MEAKFQKYWEKIPIIFGLATIMDPRFKISGLQILVEYIYQCFNGPDSGTDYENIAQINSVLQAMFEEYRFQRENTQRQSGEADTSSSQQPREKSVSGWKQFKVRLSTLNRSLGGSGTSELQRYLQEPNVEEDGEWTFDVLAWWKGQENRFPVLSAMARDLLTVPASQVASESAFSTGNRVLDDYRSRLHPDVVEQCVCLRDWYKAQQRTQTILAEEALGDQFDDVVNLN
ncbi:hypothetical protein QJS04_geneDACA019941 [Acorus gramineus]|uniref:Transposase n=1 Tax=Acorus gramineus TaxID=55184 RepID=A0AAV9AJ90_ACOGR|nr:hypothetical protein QJS04_geneDACA019941 [Acorus gramineus]